MIDVRKTWQVPVRPLLLVAAAILLGGGVEYAALGVTNGFRDHGGERKIVQANGEVASLRGAIDAFRVDCGRYPTTREGLSALRKQPEGLKTWKGPYVSVTPTDPWNHPYVYRSPGRNGRSGFTIESYGADGRPGGEGANADISDGDD